MVEALIILIVGAAAAVGALVVGIWVWLRRSRLAGSPQDQRASALLSSDANSQTAYLSADRDETYVVESTHSPVRTDEGVVTASRTDFVKTDDYAGKEIDPKILITAQSSESAIEEKDGVKPAAPIATALAPSAEDVTANELPIYPEPSVRDAVAQLTDKQERAPRAEVASIETDTYTCVEYNADNPPLRENAKPASIAEDRHRLPSPGEAAALVVLTSNVTAMEPSADSDVADITKPHGAGPEDGALVGADQEALAQFSTKDAYPREAAPIDGPIEPDGCSELARERCSSVNEDEQTEGAESEVGADASAVQSDRLKEDLGLGPLGNPKLDPPGSDQLAGSTFEEEAGAGTSAGARVRTGQPPANSAQHRDRRGRGRAFARRAVPASEPATADGAVLRTPAEARLRLMLHPIRRSATLSAVLTRPTGYPDRITLLFGEGADVRAYCDDRYDDVDLEWTADLLSGEIRLDCAEGYQWLRSGRRIHIFGEVANEPGIMSVGSAGLRSPRTIVCRSADVAAVHAAAQACGSPTLVSHNDWSGIPDGWMVLSGYLPAHTSASRLATGLTVLDPGVGSEIRFSEGLRIRAASFAEGGPPRIEIAPFPAGATVTIDGRHAELSEDGAWTADGWDRPGDHLVDVVPGPSAAYRIIEDPWIVDGWDAWDAHPQRFGASAHAPWAVAQVCGAAVLGPSGENVVAADAMRSVVCLGLRRGAVTLRARPDTPVSVGLLGEPPAFLISASGQRRRQGRIAWLSPLPTALGTRMIDPLWVAEVRSASARRLPLDGGGALAEDAWRKARERARRHKRPLS